jgi:hypothetical protein
MTFLQLLLSTAGILQVTVISNILLANLLILIYLKVLRDQKFLWASTSFCKFSWKLHILKVFIERRVARKTLESVTFSNEWYPAACCSINSTDLYFREGMFKARLLHYISYPCNPLFITLNIVHGNMNTTFKEQLYSSELKFRVMFIIVKV